MQNIRNFVTTDAKKRVAKKKQRFQVRDRIVEAAIGSPEPMPNKSAIQKRKRLLHRFQFGKSMNQSISHRLLRDHSSVPPTTTFTANTINSTSTRERRAATRLPKLRKFAGQHVVYT